MEFGQAASTLIAFCIYSRLLHSPSDVACIWWPTIICVYSSKSLHMACKLWYWCEFGEGTNTLALTLKQLSDLNMLSHLFISKATRNKATRISIGCNISRGQGTVDSVDVSQLYLGGWQDSLVDIFVSLWQASEGISKHELSIVNTQDPVRALPTLSVESTNCTTYESSLASILGNGGLWKCINVGVQPVPNYRPLCTPQH